LSIVDARALDPDSEIRVGLCIVGAGAVGITIATEVAGAACDVCLVESGGFGPDRETQSLYDLESAGHPMRENFMSRARYYGGSCNLWAGRSMKLEPWDVERRDWVADTGWPLPLGEIAAHYPRAAAILGLPAVEGFERSTYDGALSADERGIFAANALQATVSLWAKRPKRFGSAYRARLRRSRNVRLLLYANATRVNLDRDGAGVESIETRTLDGKRVVIRAKAYVLACGGLENARLLLVSRERHAAGVGNAHDLVGRYFMDHPRAVFGRVLLRPGCRLPLLRGAPLRDGKVQLGIGASPEAQRRRGLLNHYATLESEFSGYAAGSYQSMVRVAKVLLRRGYSGSRWDVSRARLGEIPGLVYLLTPKELMPHALYRSYLALRNAVHPRPYGASRVVVYFCEQAPNPASRVSLSRERDRLGLERLVLDWRLGDETTRSVMELQELIRERLSETGFGQLQPGRDLAFTDASHHMGTTRMSESPRHGVVDTECRVHGVTNLYLAGSSVFPAAGHANPTLTLLALGIRLAQRLRDVC
jgi:choline dehydrogenase-like flavoprotein